MVHDFTTPDVEQVGMFSQEKKPHFNGPDYIPKLDHKRLTTQNQVIRDFMIDGKWRTLQEIENGTGFGQASISAQLRHLKKEKFGGFTLNKQRRKLAGLFEYQILKGEKDHIGSGHNLPIHTREKGEL